MASQRVVFSLLALLLTFLIESNSHGSSDRAIFFGHNLTPSTETLGDGVWTAGNLAVAYGLTEKWMVATSPWIWASYNTANIHLKWSDKFGESSRLAYFVSYFESFSAGTFLDCTGSLAECGVGMPSPPYDNNNATYFASFRRPLRYQWQSLSNNIAYSYVFSGFATLYTNLKYSYYWNDDWAYSIRMDPADDAIRGQVDLSVLLSFPLLNSRHRINGELGCIGLNYRAPYAHAGVSFTYLGVDWLLQAGLSYTLAARELGDSTGWGAGRFDTRPHKAKSEDRYHYYRYLQTALHPEIQVQYFF